MVLHLAGTEVNKLNARGGLQKVLVCCGLMICHTRYTGRFMNQELFGSLHSFFICRSLTATSTLLLLLRTHLLPSSTNHSQGVVTQSLPATKHSSIYHTIAYNVKVCPPFSHNHHPQLRPELKLASRHVVASTKPQQRQVKDEKVFSATCYN